MRALIAIHASGVLLGKVYPRHVFVVLQKPERVAWFGFFPARCRGSDVSVRRQNVLQGRLELLLRSYGASVSN